MVETMKPPVAVDASIALKLILSLVFLILSAFILEHLIRTENEESAVLKAYKKFVTQSLEFDTQHGVKNQLIKSDHKQYRGGHAQHVFTIGSPNGAIRNRAYSGKFKQIPGMYLSDCSHKGYEAQGNIDEILALCLEMEDCFGFDFYEKFGKAYFCLDNSLNHFGERKSSTHFYLSSHDRLNEKKFSDKSGM